MDTGGNTAAAAGCPTCAGAETIYAHILSEAKERAPIAPAYLEKVLIECCKRPMPLLRSWFQEELRGIAQATDEHPPVWGELLQLAIVAAAVRQCPAEHDQADLATIWESLLDHPRFYLHAEHALARYYNQPTAQPTLNGWRQATTHPPL